MVRVAADARDVVEVEEVVVVVTELVDVAGLPAPDFSTAVVGAWVGAAKFPPGPPSGANAGTCKVGARPNASANTTALAPRADGAAVIGAVGAVGAVSVAKVARTAGRDTRLSCENGMGRIFAAAVRVGARTTVFGAISRDAWKKKMLGNILKVDNLPNTHFKRR